MNIGLSNKQIKNLLKGYSEEYYAIRENLDDLVYAVCESQSITLVKAELLEGKSNVSVLVTSKSGVEYVLRISPWRGELYTSNVFYGYLEKAGISAPIVLGYSNDCNVIPYEFQVLSYVNHDEMSNNEFVCGVEFGKALRLVHEVVTDGIGSPNPNTGWNYSNWLQALKEVYVDTTFLNCKDILYDQHIIQSIERKTIYNKENEIVKPLLLHEDVGPQNALFKSGKLVGIIDPGALISGDSMLDIAMILNDGTHFAQGVLNGYDISRLSASEQCRIHNLRLLCAYWASGYFYTTGGDYKSYVGIVRNLLQLNA